jgi:hypothetical protein
MAYDLFGTREMTQAVEQFKPVPSFFRSTFFNRPPELHNTMIVDIDIYKGQRKVAPYTKVTSKSKPMARTGFKTGAFTIPYIKISRTLEAVQTLLRSPGETIYSDKTPQERASEQLARDMRELDEAIQTAEELQAAQAICDGIIIIKGEEVDAVIDLNRDPDLEFTVGAGDLWDSGTADIHAQLRSYARLVYSKSGFTPNLLIGGSAAIDAFFADAGVQSLLDNRRLAVGNVETSPSTTPFPNARSYGTFAGYDIWETHEMYLDDADNTEKLFVPEDSIILASRNMRAVPHYGPILDFGVLAPVKRFAKSVEEKDPSIITGILQSAPAYINHDPDATAKIKVV